LLPVDGVIGDSAQEQLASIELEDPNYRSKSSR